MHLFVAITSHGYGHAAQVAPVLNALRARCTELRVTVQSSLPAAFLRERIEGGFEQIDEAPDFGLMMHSATQIDLDASAAAYRELHRHWQRVVAQGAERLRELAPDLLLADVPYLSLAAAGQAGIPTVALCSLNWADIYRHYFSCRPEADAILDQMETAYRGAQAFICPESSMPMPFLGNRVSVGPIARQVDKQGAQLRARLGVDASTRLVLVTPGGVDTRFPVEDWPSGQGIHWLVNERWQIEHPDASDYPVPGFSFTGLIGACDAVLGKCGYGTVAECVVNATPLLYIERADWPEERSLVNWLHSHDAGVPVSEDLLASGDFGVAVADLDRLQPRRAAPLGAAQAADVLIKLMDESRHES